MQDEVIKKINLNFDTVLESLVEQNIVQEEC